MFQRRMHPTTYSLCLIAIMWIVVSIVSLHYQEEWFKGRGCFIEKETISFISSNTTQNSTSSNMATDISSAIGYDKRTLQKVFVVDNTPAAPIEGLQGILYDRGESCERQHVSSGSLETTNISKIALIQHSDNCLLAAKIRNAQLDGAKGAIIFQPFNNNKSDNGSSNNNPVGLGLAKDSVQIPAYYIVEEQNGYSLIKELESLSKQHRLQQQQPNTNTSIPIAASLHQFNTTTTAVNMSTLVAPERMIRVRLFPNQPPMLRNWEFFLLIVSLMFMTGLLLLAGLQWHMWRFVKIHAASQGSADSDAAVARQTAASTDDGVREGYVLRHFEDGRLSLVDQWQLDPALIDLLPTRVYEPSPENTSTLQQNKYDLTECVICLEPFERGNILRQLPCQHEYHIDCIDVWLTKENGVCPLCFNVVDIPMLPERVHFVARADRG